MARRSKILGVVKDGHLFCDKCNSSLGPLQPFPSDVLCRRCNRWISAWEVNYGTPECTPVVEEKHKRINHTGRTKGKQMKAILEGPG